MAKKAKCRNVTFRHGRGSKSGRKGAKLARPVTVRLCPRAGNKSAKRKAGRAGANAVCRAGGTGWAAKVRANFRKGMKGARALAPARFVGC